MLFIVKKQYLFICLAIFVFSACAKKTSQKEKSVKSKPNILFVLAEDISTDLEVYGMPAVKTPVLNKLAAEGIQYMKTYGTNSICSPSRSNMITGVHQNVVNAQHHRSNRKKPLSDPYKPITSYLRDAGYTCILGSDVIKGARKVDVNFKHKALGNWNGTTEFGLFDKFDTIKKSDEPFFSQVTLTVSHRGDHWNKISEASQHKVNPADVVLPPYYAEHPVIRADWAKYLDQIEHMDYQMGLLLEDLKKKGVYENTVVIFIGDNGRCNIRGKGYLYDPGLHLPLIVNWPAGLEGGKKDKRIVSSIDVSASILDIAGIDLPDYMTAIPFINNDNNGREYVYSGRDLWDEVLEQSRAITTDKYRYIKNNIIDQPYDANQAYLEFYRPAVHIMRGLNEKDQLNELQARFFAPEKEKEELYDLENDPFETINLINDPKYGGVKQKMIGYFVDWNEKNHDFGFDPIDWDNATVAAAPKIIEWLKEAHPEIIEQMNQGIEPGFGKWGKAYRNSKK